MRSAIGNVGTAMLYSAVSLSIEGAAHRVVDASALTAKTTATLVNTWIVTPAVWFLLGLTLQCSTYVVKKSASGIYHLFRPEQPEPILLIEDRNPEVTTATP